MRRKLSFLLVSLWILLLGSSQTASVKAVVVIIPNRGNYIMESVEEPVTADPAWAYDSASGKLVANVYEPLIRFYLDRIDSFVPALSRNVPSLADNTIQFITETDPDTGLVWQERLIFHIRLTDGADNSVGNPIRFHSGNTLTMEDIEYSFERWMVQDRSGGPEWMIYEPVMGIGNYHADTSRPEWQGMAIDHAFQVSGDDFIMNLAVRYAPIMGVLAQFWAGIVDKEFVSAVPDDWSGVWGDYTEWVDHHDPAESPLDSAGNLMSGTGPYAGPGPYENPTYGIGYWTHGVEWSIVKFDGYWKGWDPSTSGTNSDFLFRITEKVVYDWSTRLADFVGRSPPRADTVFVPPPYRGQIETWPAIRARRGFPSFLRSAQRIVVDPDAIFFNFDIDPASPYVGSGSLDGNGIPLNFFSDIHIRRAFAHLFDAETFLSQVWLGEAIQPSSPIIKGIPYSIDVPTYEFSLTQAANEFQSASNDPASPAYGVWDKGFHFKVVYNRGNIPRQTALLILQNNALRVNLKFRIDTVGVDWATFLAELQYYPAYRSTMPLFVTNWVVTYPDAHSLIWPFMHSKGDFASATSYSNPMVDALIEEGIATPDGPARATIYERLQWMYYEDVPSVMVDQPLGFDVEQIWVQGWYNNPVAVPFYYYMWEGLCGDVNNDGIVNALDAGYLNAHWYDPPFYGPDALIEGYVVKYDIGPYEYRDGLVNFIDLAVINAHFGETL